MSEQMNIFTIVSSVLQTVVLYISVALLFNYWKSQKDKSKQNAYSTLLKLLTGHSNKSSEQKHLKNELLLIVLLEY